MEPASSQTGNSAEDSLEFQRFFSDRVEPIIESVATKKRSAKRAALIATAATFVLSLAVGVYFVAPLWRLPDNVPWGIIWPFLLLFPATMAVIAFSLVYILYLRTAVSDFKNDLLARLAEFIYPSVVHETGNGIPETALVSSMLFAGLGRPAGGDDRFRGGVDGAAFEFSAVEVKNGKTDQGRAPLAGLFFSARFTRQFRAPALILPFVPTGKLGDPDAALAGLRTEPGNEITRVEDAAAGLQALTRAPDRNMAWLAAPPSFKGRVRELRRRLGVEVRLSCLADRLCLAFLAPSPAAEREAVLDGFDFERFPGFCDQARVCLELTRELIHNNAPWVSP